MSQKVKVLFFNANPATMSLVPPVVSLFYSIFKEAGIEMKYFDTMAYDTSDIYADPNEFTHAGWTLKKNKKVEKLITTHSKPGKDIFKDFKEVAKEFNPDVIMASATESTFLFTIDLLKAVRDLKYPHVLGGVFATFAPEVAFKYEEIDVLCVGEGERVIVPLVRKLAMGEEPIGVGNIWFKRKGGEIIKSGLNKAVDLDSNPRFCAHIFEDTRFYRTMGGKLYRMFPIETHRGCTNKCTFCNSPLQDKRYLQETGERYFRKKSIKKVMEDVRYLKKEYNAEYFHFWADNFFTYSIAEIEEFCQEYAEINIPFYVQTYPASMNEAKLKALVEVGLDRIGMGIEHGNEEFRKNVINRKYSNKSAIEGVELIIKYDIHYSCNNIVGFPDETPKLHEDTVRLNRILAPHSASASIFTPFYGTPLRKICIQKGYLKDPDYIAPSNTDSSCLDMPQFTKEEIMGKSRTFNMKITLPKDLWKDITVAENITPDGNRVYNDLLTEMRKYA